MKVLDFLDLVHRMRQAQTEYFTHRTDNNLRRAMSLEKEVDQILLRMLEYKKTQSPEQQTLFPKREKS
jgi:hypothetical protein